MTINTKQLEELQEVIAFYELPPEKIGFHNASPTQMQKRLEIILKAAKQQLSEMQSLPEGVMSAEDYALAYMQQSLFHGSLAEYIEQRDAQIMAMQSNGWALVPIDGLDEAIADAEQQLDYRPFASVPQVYLRKFVQAAKAYPTAPQPDTRTKGDSHD